MSKEYLLDEGKNSKSPPKVQKMKSLNKFLDTYGADDDDKKEQIKSDHEQIEVFRKLADRSDEIEPQIVPTKSKMYGITNDNNLIQFEADTLALWSLKTHKKIISIPVSKVSFIHPGSEGKRYFVGFDNGDVKVYDNCKLEEIKLNIPNMGSKVTSICSTQKYCIVSSAQGKVIVSYYETGEVAVLNEGDGKTQVIDLKVSPMKHFLYGLLDKSPGEKMLVWNVQTAQLVHQHDLDIADKSEDNEDVSKLMTHHTADASLMFIRGCFRKGINVLSFDDGVLIDEIPNMHNNSILQLIIKYDKEKKEQTLITCGKDKKVKVWDWMNRECLATLSQHADEVNSVVLTSDHNQSILFSGSKDQRVIAWHTSNWVALFELNLEHPIYTLRLTTDNEILIAIADQENGQMSTLRLEENQDSVRLNIPRKVYENNEMSITNDSKFIIATMESSNSIEIWSVESKVLAFKIKQVQPGKIAVACSEDNQYMFYTSDNNEVTQMELKYNNIVARYKGSHTGEIVDLSVSPDGERLVTAGAKGELCFYMTPSTISEDIVKQVENYGELPKVSGGYKMVINMHGEQGNQKCVVLTKQNELVIADITHAKKVNSLKIPTSMQVLTNISITMDNGRIIASGKKTTNIIEVNLTKISEKEKAITCRATTHTGSCEWGQLTFYGKYYISTSHRESIVWDMRTFEPVLDQGVRFTGLHAQNRLCRGIIQDGLYIRWKPKTLHLWDSNIPLEDEPDDDKFDDDNDQVKEMTKKVKLVLDKGIKKAMTTKISGPFNKIYPKMLKTMMNGAREDQILYIDAMKSNVIQPQRLNLIHLYAYNDDAECLNQAFIKGVKYQQDNRQRTPLEFAMERNSYECTNIILNNLFESDQAIKDMKQEEFTKLIEFSPSNLTMLFENVEQITPGLTQFAYILDGKDSIFRCTESFDLKENDIQMMITTDKPQKDLYPIQFKHILMDINMTPGSQESIEFHKTLANTEATAIFQTETIRKLLEYKWEINKKVMQVLSMSDLLLYINFIWITQPDVYNLDRDLGTKWNTFNWFFMLLWFQALLTTASEIFQILAKDSIIDHISDLFNLADMCKTTFLWMWIYYNTNGNRTKGHHGLAAALNFLLFFKIFTGMIQFRDYRVLFRLVKQVIIDMIPFTGFLIMSMILFGTTFYHLNTTSKEIEIDGGKLENINEQARPIYGSILYEYLLIFGEFDMDGFETDTYGERWMLFFMATVLLQLVMLNLLIAIMSDTYAKVMSEIEISNGLELNNLIIEAESLKFFNRKNVSKNVLHWVEYKTESEGSWGGGAEQVTSALSATEEILTKALRLQRESLRSLQQRMATQTTFSNIKNDELSKKMDTLMAQSNKKMDHLMTLFAGGANIQALQKDFKIAQPAENNQESVSNKPEQKDSETQTKNVILFSEQKKDTQLQVKESFIYTSADEDSESSDGQVWKKNQDS